MFDGTDSVFNTDSVPSDISYKSFKTQNLPTVCKIPTVITETHDSVKSAFMDWEFFRYEICFQQRCNHANIFYFMGWEFFHYKICFQQRCKHFTVKTQC